MQVDTDCGFNKADEQESYEARKIIEEQRADKVHNEPICSPNCCSHLSQCMLCFNLLDCRLALCRCQVFRALGELCCSSALCWLASALHHIKYTKLGNNTIPSCMHCAALRLYFATRTRACFDNSSLSCLQKGAVEYQHRIRDVDLDGDGKIDESEKFVNQRSALALDVKEDVDPVEDGTWVKNVNHSLKWW